MHQSLLKWFYKNQRKLPFRETKEPYKIWVSEVMLQQTKVAAMLNHFDSFIHKFPNIETLAKSNIEEVLKYWKGLGYYSRAINLHKGSQYIVDHLNSTFPKDYKEVIKIPGIGSYTASAILSISFNLPFAVLDGNVKRVLSRLFYFKQNILSPKSNIILQNIANEFLNQDAPGDHNQALMELGATICLPQNPICMLCPIQSNCIAFQKQEQQNLPVRKKEKSFKEIYMTFYFIEYNHKYLLIKDKNRRFFKTIYSLPFTIDGNNLDKIYLQYPLKEYLLNSKSKKSDSKSFKHSITNHKIKVDYKKIKMKKSELDILDNYNIRWIEFNDLKTEFPSSISEKLIKLGA